MLPQPDAIILGLEPFAPLFSERVWLHAQARFLGPFWYSSAAWIFSRTALWYTPGVPPVGMRLVIIADSKGKRRLEAFCTDVQATPVQIVQWVIMRCSVAVTFEEARVHLEVETQRQWSE